MIYVHSTSNIVHPPLMGEYTDFEAYLLKIHLKLLF